MKTLVLVMVLLASQAYAELPKEISLTSLESRMSHRDRLMALPPDFSKDPYCSIARLEFSNHWAAKSVTQTVVFKLFGESVALNILVDATEDKKQEKVLITSLPKGWWSDPKEIHVRDGDMGVINICKEVPVS